VIISVTNAQELKEYITNEAVGLQQKRVRKHLHIGSTERKTGRKVPGTRY